MKMNQCDKVLKYMKEHGSITQREAVYHLNVFRLSARISDLRESGVKIRTENEPNKDEFGYHARYFLEEE